MDFTPDYSLGLNNVLFCQERIAFYSRLQIRQINIHKPNGLQDYVDAMNEFN